MRKSSKNFKEGSSPEVSKAVLKSNYSEGKKQENDRLKNYKGAKSLSGSSVGASVV